MEYDSCDSKTKTHIISIYAMSGVSMDHSYSPHELAPTSDIEGTTPSDSATDELYDSVGCRIGIDFGRMKCEVAVVTEDGTVSLIPLEAHNPGNCFSLPSFVSMGVSGSGGWEVGQQAVSRAKAGHPYTVYDLTMLLGKKVEALLPQDVVARWSFEIQPGIAGKAVVECPTRNNSPDLVYPEQIAAMLLSTIKDRAEVFTGKRVARVVVTVPASYNRTQRQALRDACRIAGLHVENLVVSSTASAVANSESAIDAAAAIFEKTVVAVDCGGGSLNVTLARVGENRSENRAEKSSARVGIQVEATAGNLETGGEVLTDCLWKHFQNEAIASDTSPGTASSVFSRRLRRSCALAQKILSTSQQAAIDVPPWQTRRGGRDSSSVSGMAAGFRSTISREDFESLCGTELWNCLPAKVEQVLTQANVKKEDVDAVLVTGGTMQVPKFREVLGECFAEHWNRIVDSPPHSVAIGAALIAAQNGSHLLYNEPTPLGLGIRSASGDTLIVVPPGTPVPTRQTRVYYAICQNEIAFDILEGNLDPDQKTNHRPGSELEHCLGRVLVDGNRASAQLILKLEIAFEVDASDYLTVVVSDRSNNRVTRLLVAGDETCLSAQAIALAQAYLDEKLQNSAATNGASTSSSSLALTLSPNDTATLEGCPIDNLRACVATFQPMVLANDLSVCISPGDLFILHSKIENASEWLDRIDPSQQNRQTTDQQVKTAREYLRQLRLLHLSSTASSALAQLRHEMTLSN